MKLDMGEAWSQAVAMLSANRDLIGIVAGVFFFLPYCALMLMMPDLQATLPMSDPNADPQVMIDALMEFYSRIWLPLAAIIIFQAIGSLALLALLRDSTRPTLGEALKLALVAFLPYVAAQLILGLAVGVLGAILIGGAVAASQALGVLMIFVVMIGVIYAMVKFCLTTPVIAIERIYNPFTALARSWRLTKGNSLRIFFFFFLIALAGIILVSIIQAVFGLVFALLGAEGELIGNGIVSSVLNAAFSTVFLAVLAATHRQLAGGGAAAEA